ncbi:MAG: phage recombination protein Bet [Solirubrobacterales bacterium]
MSPENTTKQNGAEAVFGFSPEEVALIEGTLLKPRTRKPYPEEVKLFCKRCEASNLDPFKGEIYAVFLHERRAGDVVMSVRTSIDGLRLIAERTGHYAGQEDVLHCGEDGRWADLWPHRTPPLASKARVLKLMQTGQIVVTSAVARFGDYAERFDDGNLKGLWRQMPPVMGGKVAEALALRKAFPGESSGIYTDDELAHHSNGESEVGDEGSAASGLGPNVVDFASRRSEGTATTEPPATRIEPGSPASAAMVAETRGPAADPGGAPPHPEVRARLGAAVEGSGLTVETAKELCRFFYGTSISDRLSTEQVGDLAGRLEAIGAASVGEATLKGQLTKAGAREDRNQARATIDRWILRRASEAGEAS